MGGALSVVFQPHLRESKSRAVKLRGDSGRDFVLSRRAEGRGAGRGYGGTMGIEADFPW